MIISAIDPSLTNTAIVTSDPASGPEAYKLRCFNSPPEGRNLRDRFGRYEHFVAQINDYLKSLGTTHVFLEGYSYASKGSVITLAEVGAILRWHLIEYPEAHEVAPKHLKKFVTGSGNADKVVMASHVTRRWGVCLNSSDEFDSYGLWRFGRCYLGVDEPATKDQLIAVEEFKYPDAPKKKQKDVTMRQVKPRKDRVLPPPSEDMPF